MHTQRGDQQTKRPKHNRYPIAQPQRQASHKRRDHQLHQSLGGQQHPNRAILSRQPVATIIAGGRRRSAAHYINHRLTLITNSITRREIRVAKTRRPSRRCGNIDHRAAAQRMFGQNARYIV